MFIEEVDREISEEMVYLERPQVPFQAISKVTYMYISKLIFIWYETDRGFLHFNSHSSLNRFGLLSFLITGHSKVGGDNHIKQTTMLFLKTGNICAGSIPYVRLHFPISRMDPRKDRP